VRRESHDGLRQSLRGFLTLLRVSPIKYDPASLLGAISKGNQIINHKIRKSGQEEHRAVLTTMLSFFSVLSLTSLPDVIREKEVQSLSSMTMWVLTTWATRSWAGLVAEVKAISLYARSRAFRLKTDRSYNRLLRRFGFVTSRTVLAQVAALGRALPPALAPQCQKALKDHRVALESDGKAPTTSPDVLLQLESFGREYARRFRPSQPLARPWLGPGACLESPRSAGGQLGALAKWESEWESRESIPFELRRKPDDFLPDWIRATLYGPPPAEDARIVADSLYRDAEKLASLSSFPIGEKFQCRRVVVTEPGCKARIVSCHPIQEIALAQYLRMAAFGSLKRFPATAAVLRGDVLGSLDEVFKGVRRPKSVCSADLTNATDYLHQDAAIALCRSVFKGWGYPDSILDRLPSLLGAHEFDGWSNSRGILMGGPLSWFVLCLMNSFCALRGHSFKHGLKFFRVCGDDLIANFSKSEFKAYESLCSSVGFRLNRAKSFVARDSGVFMELSFSFRFRTEREDEPFPPLRGPVKSVNVLVIDSVDPFPVIPAKVFRFSDSRELCWHTVGPTLSAALLRVPVRKRNAVLLRTRRLVGMLRPGLSKALYEAGIDAAAPRVLGGAELPWIGRFTTKTRKLASILASKDLPFKAIKDADGELLLAADIGGAYKLEASAQGADLVRGCALGDIPANRIIYRPAGLEATDVTIGRWAEIVRDAEGLHGRQLRAWGVIPPAKGDPLRLSIGRVAREVRRRQAKLISVYPQAPVTHHLYESLAKRFKLEDVYALPYKESLVVTHDAGRRTERLVPCGADVQCNRRYYRLLLPAFFTQRCGVGVSQV
jgi:hypothetical protein